LELDALTVDWMVGSVLARKGFVGIKQEQQRRAVPIKISCCLKNQA
jgi:hypothetical protein